MHWFSSEFESGMAIRSNSILTLLVFVVLTTICRGQATTEPLSGGQKNGLSPDPGMFLQQTERLFQPATIDQRLALANELQARGVPDAAKAIVQSIATTESDFVRLTRTLLQIGETQAASELLKSWRRTNPASRQNRLLQGTLYHASGEWELAIRELRPLLDDPPNRPMARLQIHLLEMAARGSPAGIDVNPWHVTFEDENRGFVAGRIAEVQKSKVNKEDVETLMQIVQLLPRLGNLWALLGQCLNAFGEPIAALECFRRAELLLYTPARLRECKRVLETHRSQVQQMANSAFQSAPTEKTSPSAGKQAPPDSEGWANLPANPKMLTVLAIGGVTLLLLAYLQIRDWLRRVRPTHREPL